MHSDIETTIVLYRSQQTILERPAWRNEEFELDILASSQGTSYLLQIMTVCKKATAQAKDNRK